MVVRFKSNETLGSRLILSEALHQADLAPIFATNFISNAVNITAMNDDARIAYPAFIN